MSKIQIAVEEDTFKQLVANGTLTREALSPRTVECPFCDETIEVNVVNVPLSRIFPPEIHYTLSFSCPTCGCVQAYESKPEKDLMTYHREDL